MKRHYKCRLAGVRGHNKRGNEYPANITLIV